MKAPFVRSVLLLSLFMLLSGCTGRTVRFSHDSGSTGDGPVVLLGDSLGAGYQVGKDEGFVAVLEQRLGINITNLAVAGATTADGVPRVKEEVLPLKPSLVILELGGNDALQRVDPVTTRANLASMIEQIQAQRIPVLLLGIRGGVIGDDYADLFEGLADEYETAYVPDLLQGILTRPELKLDSIHPNAKGHQMLADRIEPELRRVLEAIKGDL